MGRAGPAGGERRGYHRPPQPELGRLPQGNAFAFSPPAIQGVGTAGGVTFILEDRAGKDIAYLADNTRKFIAAAPNGPSWPG